MSLTESRQFDVDALVKAACEQAGADDFGTLPFREGLGVLAETYDSNLRDHDGRQRCSDRLLNLLVTRLKCEASLARLPAIADEKIEAPIFVTGLPRTATSALINLLNAAPENRGLLQWEIQFPDIWPGSEPGQQDPRYPYLVKGLAESRDPEFEKIHHVDADTPEECVMLHAFAFTGVQLGFEIQLQPYRDWLLRQDLVPMYAYQKRLLQMLQWRRPGGRWVLKAPAHMWGIEAILEVFPDARFIWCHRHPLHSIPSINSMNRAVMRMYAGDMSHIDPAVMGASVMEWYALSLERGLSSRSRLPEKLFADCSQREFVDEPLALVERVYQQFGEVMEPESREALHAHVQEHPRGKHGRHDYDLASFGLTESMIENRFRFYIEDDRWPISD
jgi:hypothetical protein